MPVLELHVDGIMNINVFISRVFYSTQGFWGSFVLVGILVSGLLSTAVLYIIVHLHHPLLIHSSGGGCWVGFSLGWL